MHISTGNFDSTFFLRVTIFLNLENLAKMKNTTVCLVQEMLIWSFWGEIYIPFFVRLPVPNAWNCHSLYSLYTAFSSNVGAWGMWACSLFLSCCVRLCCIWLCCVWWCCIDDVSFCFYRDATAERLHQTLRGTQLQHIEPPQQTHEGKKVNGIQKSQPQVQSSLKVKVNLVIKLSVIFPW